MAANFQIEYSPAGISHAREIRFVGDQAKTRRDDARKWAIDYARLLAQRIEQERVRARLVAEEQEAHAQAAEANRFQMLSTQWRNETAHYSVSLKRAMHPAYQQIIGMGEKALPHILKCLRDDPGRDWFWALKAITGEDAAANETAIESAIQAWIRWAEQHNM